MSVYYPVGTIVKLTIDKDMFFMISGYLTRQGDREIYDYFAVPFPMGLVKDNQYILFNRKCITDIIHIGYCDDECQNVLDGFDQLVENLKATISNEESLPQSNTNNSSMDNK